MRASRSSKTAQQVALSRALETRKPPGERICDDPFAERFLDPHYRLLLLSRSLRDAVERTIESRFAGHHWYVIARTRYLDDFLAEQLADAPAQLVILGAGFDSRAYRFAGAITETTVFEVDHPATSAQKLRKVQRLLGAAPVHVRYAPVDFTAEKLADRLRQSGYRDGLRNVFLWEGVTPYLSAPAVDEVLAFVQASSAPGSVVLFDYVIRSLVEGRCDLPGARNELDRMRQTSEPLTFGLDETRIAPYLAARGFSEVVDVGAAELHSRYFRDPARYIKPWWRIVRATIEDIAD